jgi:hypothetical protein
MENGYDSEKGCSYVPMVSENTLDLNSALFAMHLQTELMLGVFGLLIGLLIFNLVSLQPCIFLLHFIIYNS